jgi:predicted transcriptional regulator
MFGKQSRISSGRREANMETKITRREPLQIIREILDLGTTCRTEIRLSIGLTTRQLDYYVEWLVRKGFLKEETPDLRRVRQFRVTEKGEKLLGLMDELVGLPGFENFLGI